MILYAGTYDGGVFKSRDAGANWSAVNEGLGGSKILSLAIDPAASYKIFAGSSDSAAFTYASGSSSLNVPLNAGGAVGLDTIGAEGSTRTGYASLKIDSGSIPYGTAVFRFRQDGIVVSETGVPASPPTTSARVFIDYRSDVLGVPGRSDSGRVNINTGIGIVNYGVDVARITFTLFDMSGAVIAAGQGTLAAGHHLAKFTNQIHEMSPDFVLPSDFHFGSMSIASDQPLSVMALRMTINQRGDVLFATTPVADGSQALTNTSIYFPQLADGGGWTTSLVLMNTSASVENGFLNIFDNSGRPLVVHQAGGTAASSFQYSIPAGGAFRFQTEGGSEDAKVGWMQVVPDPANSTPVGSGVYGYNPVDILTMESGIPSAGATKHARIFIDLTNHHDTGLAIANLNGATASIAIQAFQADGATPAGTSQGSLQLAGFGHDAAFADQLISGLPTDFKGVLDINSAALFSAITVRSLYNERDDFLATAFPIADATRTAPSPIVFPHIADGGGYETEFMLISPEGESNTTLNLFDETGIPIDVLD
jgi:hypothetical protein